MDYDLLDKIGSTLFLWIIGGAFSIACTALAFWIASYCLTHLGLPLG